MRGVYIISEYRVCLFSFLTNLVKVLFRVQSRMKSAHLDSAHKVKVGVRPWGGSPSSPFCTVFAEIV